MDKDILNEVIEAEKEIQQCIEQEQERLRAWLDQVKREAAESVAREEKDDQDALGRALEDAKREAEAKAKQIVDDAAAQAARTEQFDDGTLAGIVMKQLPRILLE
jgi:vacuolar-type H+-ATPase subunit H